MPTTNPQPTELPTNLPDFSKMGEAGLRAQTALYLMEPDSGLAWLDTMIMATNKRRVIVSATLYNEQRFNQPSGLYTRVSKAFTDLYPDSPPKP